MNKVLFTSIIIMVASNIIPAQDAANLRTFYSIGRINATSSFGGMLNAMPTYPNTINGNYYFDDDTFREGFISIRNIEKPFGPFQMRYNLHSNELEVNLKEGIRSLSLDKVTSFMWINNKAEEFYFASCKGLKINNTPLDGFAQVISGEKLVLLKKRKAILKKSTFNPLEVENSSVDKIVKEDDYFLLLDSSTINITKEKKRILSFFKGKYENEVSKFLKNNDFNPKKENTLIAFTEFYNKLN
ncbi:MAG: hypothetical protein ING84_14400 [Cytophagales bacterium]|nr:hypothetical protein [Cytophagales bacterium]MCA6365614.1 hypothetical protein [Cytophagales bacterium]MCA6373405.1 hypothetical protein [Cytophagales bacterium]MCA6377746.1 hypothetical protein [Cytophagales bacterium]MCA6383045.1 hypothetical protein [Cytophagales bacterium]